MAEAVVAHDGAKRLTRFIHLQRHFLLLAAVCLFLDAPDPASATASVFL